MHARLQAHLPQVRVRGVDCGSVAHLNEPGRQLISRTLGRAARLCSKLISAKPLGMAAEAGEDVPEYPFGPLPARFVSAVLAELQTGFDLVQLEFVQMLSLGACLPTDVPKLFVHHQLQFVYLQRRAAVRSYVGYARYLEQLMLVQEKAYLQVFDGVVVFSDEDGRRLRGWVPDEKIFVSPFPVIGGSTESGNWDAETPSLIYRLGGTLPEPGWIGVASYGSVAPDLERAPELQASSYRPLERGHRSRSFQLSVWNSPGSSLIWPPP